MNFDNLLQKYLRWDARYPYLTPAITTVAFGFLLVSDLMSPPSPDEGRDVEDLLGNVLAFLMVLPVVTLKRFPLASMIVIMAAFVAHASQNYQLVWISQITAMAGLYQVASTTDTRQSIFGGLIAAGAIIAVGSVMRDDHIVTIILLTFFVVIWVVGNVIRERRSRLVAAELTVEELSAEQERAATEAIRDERTRIAQELHDVLGHTLNLMVIQAGAAQRVSEKSPEKVTEILNSIESVGRQALSDVDRMLGILRVSQGSDQSDLSRGEARPSMTRVSALVEQIRATGQALEFELFGDIRSLPPSTDLTAFRVVQEALTNVLTHASGSAARLKVEYLPDRLAISVDNDGSGTERLDHRSSGGRGLVGMRERVQLFGGDFTASSTPDDGWKVEATFPLTAVTVEVEE